MNNLKTLKLVMRALAVFALGFSNVPAASLSLTSSQSQFSVGDTLNVSLSISGLGDHSALSLGAFDIPLAWSANFLFVNAAFGTGLGPTLFDTIDNPDSNHLRLSQLSLASVAELNANQPGSFSLATLSFLVKDFPKFSGGNIVIETAFELSDENGNALSASLVNDGGINFSRREKPENPTAVPLPAAGLLFAVGFTFVEGVRRWSSTLAKA